MTPEEINRMTLQDALLLGQRAAEQQLAKDRAKVRAAIESGGRSGDPGDVIRNYVARAVNNARDEYKDRNSIPAWQPVPNAELGWDVTVDDIDLALLKIRQARWARATVQTEVRKLAANSGGIIDAERFLKGLGAG